MKDKVDWQDVSSWNMLKHVGTHEANHRCCVTALCSSPREVSLLRCHLSVFVAVSPCFTLVEALQRNDSNDQTVDIGWHRLTSVDIGWLREMEKTRQPVMARSGEWGPEREKACRASIRRHSISAVCALLSSFCLSSFASFASFAMYQRLVMHCGYCPIPVLQSIAYVFLAVFRPFNREEETSFCDFMWFHVISWFSSTNCQHCITLSTIQWPIMASNLRLSSTEESSSCRAIQGLECECNTLLNC